MLKGQVRLASRTVQHANPVSAPIPQVMPPKDTPLSKKRKHKATYSVEQVISNEIQAVTVEALEKHLNTMYKNATLENFRDIDLFVDVQELILEARQLTEGISHYKENPGNAGKTVKAICFSSVKSSHLEFLGIHKEIKVPSLETFYTISKSLLSKKILEKNTDNLGYLINEFWEVSEEPLMLVMKDIIKVASLKPEASARLLIDQIMLSCIRFLNSVKQDPMLFPELCISSTNKPVVIEISNNATFLTGKVDYAMFLLTLENEISNELKMALQSVNNLSDLLCQEAEGRDTLRQLLITNAVNLFLVEAKNGSYDEGLGQHVPQAIAESLATITVVGSTCIGWCLTTGKVWIFGAISKEQSHCKVRHSKPIVLDPDNPTSLRDIFTLIVFWVTHDSESLYNSLND